jgi:hypothetical protein
MKKALLYTLFGSFVVYWVLLHVSNTGPDASISTVFSSSYIIIALLGGLFGLKKAQYWGGFKSLLGKTLGFLSLGLLLTTLDSFTLSFYYYVLSQEPSYPSLTEVFYFSGILSYIVGVFYLSKTIRSWSLFNNNGFFKRIMLVIIPLAMVGLTTSVYISRYGQIDGAPVSAIITDFAYAFSQAIYAFIAIAVLINSSKLFGGKLQKAVIVLLLALVVQYAADYNYSYQILSETWHTAGYGELLYLSAYTLIGLSILMFEINTPKLDNGEA